MVVLLPLLLLLPLQTNNPRKLDVLTQLGVTITGRIPCTVQAGEFNRVGADDSSPSGYAAGACSVGAW
jgi:GTP cyclohydrolase II